MDVFVVLQMKLTLMDVLIFFIGFSVVEDEFPKGSHITPAASVESQSVSPHPSKWQRDKCFSMPVQNKLSIQNLSE